MSDSQVIGVIVDHRCNVIIGIHAVPRDPWEAVYMISEVIEEPFGRLLGLQRWIRHGERAKSSRRGFQKRSSLHASTCAGQLRL